MENEKIETITAQQLTAGETFPAVNINAIESMAGNIPPAEPKTENEPKTELDGYNRELHEYPPRKNKRGEWAKRRGNKKGFIVGKRAEPTSEPTINIPPAEPTAEEIAQQQAEATATINALEVSTQQASFIISNCFFVGLRIYSDYEPTQSDAQAHQQACYDYLMTTGGVDLPNWATLAVLSAQQIMLASQKPKAKTRLQKMKEWFVLKFYAWKNRRKNGTEAQAPKTAQTQTEQI